MQNKFKIYNKLQAFYQAYNRREDIPGYSPVLAIRCLSKPWESPSCLFMIKQYMVVTAHSKWLIRLAHSLCLQTDQFDTRFLLSLRLTIMFLHNTLRREMFAYLVFSKFCVIPRPMICSFSFFGGSFAFRRNVMFKESYMLLGSNLSLGVKLWSLFKFITAFLWINSVFLILVFRMKYVY